LSGFAYLVHDDRVDAATPDVALTQSCAFAWIHLDGRTDETIAWIQEQARLDPLVAGALVATETRPRTEFINGGALVNLRGRSSEEMRSSDPLASLRLWAEKGRVISVSRLPLVALPHVRKQIEAGSIRDPGDLIAALASAITADLDPEVGELGDRLDDCEEMIDGDKTVELRRTVAKARSQAIGYRRFVAPQRLALERLAETEADWLDEADRRHLREAADRAARMTEELESIRERAALIHEALTDLRAETIDSRSLIIAIVAMIFLPLTFITGLLGMNVQGIPYAESPWAFWGVVALCLTLALGVAAYFIREHWVSH
jgi:zinc transporter